MSEYFDRLEARYGITSNVQAFDKNGLTQGRVINPFTNDLDNYLRIAWSNGRIPTMIYPDSIGFEMTSVQGNMLENWRELSAAYPNPKIQTIEKEIAAYRGCIYRGDKEPRVEKSSVAKTLFLEYMLKTFVCYIEFVNPYTGVTKKCIGTRNVDLIKAFLPETPDNTIASMKAGLEIRSMDVIESGEIGVYPFKIDKTAEKSGIFKTTGVGRKINFNLTGTIMRIMPLSMLITTVKTLLVGQNMIFRNYVQIAYLKDDNKLRVITTTGEASKLNDVYRNMDIVNELLEGCKVCWERGYIQVPDIELPRNEYGCRAINVNRLVRVDPLMGYNPSTAYVDIDLKGVCPMFCSHYLTLLADNPKTLVLIGAQLGDPECNRYISGDMLNLPSGVQLTSIIRTYVNMKESSEGKQFQKKLHDYMINNREYFPDYTGLI